MDNDPHQLRAVVTFEDQGGKTLLTMSAVFATAELRDEVVRESGAIEGANQHLECLDQYLTSEGAALPAGRRVEITRVFDAPRDQVWEAWTRPERFVQWWSPRNFTTPMCEIDLRPGGRLRFLMRPKEGPDIWCGGVFQHVEAPSKLVFTDYFTKESGEVAFPTECSLSEEWPVQALVTVLLEDLGGKTRLTLRHDASGGLPEEFEGAEQVGARASTASESCSRANETRFRRGPVRTRPRRLRGLRRNSSPRNPSTSRRRPEAGADTTANLVQPEWYSPPV